MILAAIALAADPPAIAVSVFFCLVFAWIGYRAGLAHRERCPRK